MSKDVASPLPQIASTEEMLQEFQLADISTLGFSAKSAFTTSPLLREVKPKENAAQTHLEMQMRSSTDKAEFLLRFKVNDEQGEIGVEVLALYTASQPFGDIPKEILTDFGGRVALMALYPYVREIVQTASTKVMDHSIILPILKNGEINFLDHSVS